MNIVLLAFLQSGLLELFAENREIEGWEETAWSWLVWAVIISVIVATVMLLVKVYKKSAAGNIVGRTWGWRRTWKHIGLGLPLVLAAALGIWYFSRDFNNVVGVKGLGTGIMMAWLLYVIFMVFVHLVSSWRNEIR